jgi:hypothetical protein
VRDVAATVADQPPVAGQQAFLRKGVERGQHQSLGEVTSGTEQDEDRRSFSHPASFPPTELIG